MARRNMNIPDGAKVKYKHVRRCSCDHETLYASTYAIKDLGCDINPRGGRTQAYLILPDGHIHLGEAFVSPKDQYNKKLGRNIALGRALKDYYQSINLI